MPLPWLVFFFFLWYDGIEVIPLDITQTFYDNLASHYDKLFLDWQTATQEQAVVLDTLFRHLGFDSTSRILDCACGIGTQAIGLAKLGYPVTASDFSSGALAEAKDRAANNKVAISFAQADFRSLEKVFPGTFDIVIAMDNALPHMLSEKELDSAIKSITGKVAPGGLFVASIRDYDALLAEKPAYSPPYIHKTEAGQRVSFQTWEWNDDRYHLTQYIIDDQNALAVNKFRCEYRATRREELTRLLLARGFRRVEWKFPEETGFYQPIVIAL